MNPPGVPPFRRDTAAGLPRPLSMPPLENIPDYAYGNSGGNNNGSSSGSGTRNGSSPGTPRFGNDVVDLQRKADRDDMLMPDVSRVLIIYTGGTIGMKNHRVNGYTPEKEYLAKTLKAMSQFHSPDPNDPHYQQQQQQQQQAASRKASSVSTANPQQPPSSSVNATTSQLQRMALTPRPTPGLVSPQAASMPVSPIVSATASTGNSEPPIAVATPVGIVHQSASYRQRQHTAPTISTAAATHAINQLSADSIGEEDENGTTLSYGGTITPDESMNGSAPSVSTFATIKARTDGRLPPQDEWLITPPSLYGKRIKYCVLEYDPLLDSVNMTMADWVKIATDIEKFYSLFDAFIILHGTDTMAYTASALSFMLENLGKTVIITGSQVPISEVRNDAAENLLGALTIAGHFVIPEVSLYFGQRLYRGNRVSKISAVDFEAFDSPNLPPLVSVGININVNWPIVWRPSVIAKFRAQKQMDPNVAILRLFPGITAEAIRAFMSPPIRGVVLETYGAGNAPNTRPDFLQALDDARARGVVVVNVTQCSKGTVSDAYATGKALARVGVVPGRDMTSECALAKLSYLLGCGLSPAECRDLLNANIRGELTAPASNMSRFALDQLMISGVGQARTMLQYLAYIVLTQPSASDAATHSALATDLGPATTGAAAAVGGGGVGGGNGSGMNDRRGTEVHNRLLAWMESVSSEERRSLRKSLYPILMCAVAGSNDVYGIRLIQSLAGAELPSNCADCDGRTPLHIAASDGHLASVEELLRCGAGLHLRDRYGHTPLFDAVREKRSRVMEVLIQAGAHFNEEEMDDVTYLLHKAASEGDRNLVRLLAHAGADMGRGLFGGSSTAADVARNNGHDDIADYITGKAKQQQRHQLQQ